MRYRWVVTGGRWVVDVWDVQVGRFGCVRNGVGAWIGVHGRL